MSKVDLRLQCGMPCSKLEVSTVQHGTLSRAGYLHQSQIQSVDFVQVCASSGRPMGLYANNSAFDGDTVAESRFEIV